MRTTKVNPSSRYSTISLYDSTRAHIHDRTQGIQAQQHAWKFVLGNERRHDTAVRLLRKKYQYTSIVPKDIIRSMDSTPHPQGKGAKKR